MTHESAETRSASATRFSATPPFTPATDDTHIAGLKPADAERVTLIERSLLVLLVIGLFVGVAAVVKPFTTALLFGASLATAGWPLRQYLLHRGFSRSTAAAVLVLSSVAVVGFPVLAVAPNIVEQLGKGTQQVQSYFAASPAPPAWLSGLPLAGRHLVNAWDRFVEAQGTLRGLPASYAATIEETVVVAAKALADSVVQVVLSLVVATMFWINGDVIIATLRDALRRLGGTTAEQSLDVAASAIRGVAYGVVGTAAIQAILLSVGLAIADVPGAAMLGFIGLLIAISQIGAPLLVLIWGGAAWWLFAHDHQMWGWFMIVWGLFVSTIDNFIKPWLIGFGMQMPLSLTILGVFGGFIAFGFLGLFIGPTLIAVLFTLLRAWRAAAEAAPAQD